MTVEDLPRLEAEAQSFAQQLTDTCVATLPACNIGFGARIKPASGARSSHAWVATFASRENAERLPIALTVGGRPRLNLLVDVYLAWDSAGQFLRTEKSTIRVEPAGRREPLFRYDYLRESAWKPNAYLHVHAHRDEFAHLIFEGKADRARSRLDGDPIMCALQDVHFPLGGDRFRPCLEDVLEMLIKEFGVDAKDGWQDALAEGRRKWRDIQLAAAVRDNPPMAVTALEQMGYTVTRDESREARSSRLHY